MEYNLGQVRELAPVQRAPIPFNIQCRSPVPNTTLLITLIIYTMYRPRAPPIPPPPSCKDGPTGKFREEIKPGVLCEILAGRATSPQGMSVGRRPQSLSCFLSAPHPPTRLSLFLSLPLCEPLCTWEGCVAVCGTCGHGTLHLRRGVCLCLVGGSGSFTLSSLNHHPLPVTEQLTFRHTYKDVENTKHLLVV